MAASPEFRHSTGPSMSASSAWPLASSSLFRALLATPADSRTYSLICMARPWHITAQRRFAIVVNPRNEDGTKCLTCFPVHLETSSTGIGLPVRSSMTWSALIFLGTQLSISDFAF